MYTVFFFVFLSGEKLIAMSVMGNIMYHQGRGEKCTIKGAFQICPNNSVVCMCVYECAFRLLRFKLCS